MQPTSYSGLPVSQTYPKVSVATPYGGVIGSDGCYWKREGAEVKSLRFPFGSHGIAVFEGCKITILMQQRDVCVRMLSR